MSVWANLTFQILLPSRSLRSEHCLPSPTTCFCPGWKSSGRQSQSSMGDRRAAVRGAGEPRSRRRLGGLGCLSRPERLSGDWRGRQPG